MSLLHPIKERPDGRKVRYAVVGAGWIAQEDFMPGVEHTGNSVMTALVTGDAEKAKEIAKKYDIEHVYDYDGFDKMLAAGVIDAIYLATPNSKHTPFVVKALEAGIHVLCEKPMAPTEGECLQMIAASEKSGCETHDRLPPAFRGGDDRGDHDRPRGQDRTAALFQQHLQPAGIREKLPRRRRELGRADCRHGAIPDQRRAPAFRGGAHGDLCLLRQQQGGAFRADRRNDDRRAAVSRATGWRNSPFPTARTPGANTSSAAPRAAWRWSRALRGSNRLPTN